MDQKSEKQDLPSSNQTWQWKIHHLNMFCHINPSICRRSSSQPRPAFPEAKPCFFRGVQPVQSAASRISDHAKIICCGVMLGVLRQVICEWRFRKKGVSPNHLYGFGHFKYIYKYYKPSSYWSSGILGSQQIRY